MVRMVDEIAALRAEIAQLRRDLDHVLEVLGEAPAGEGVKRHRLPSISCEAVQIHTDATHMPIEISADENQAGIYLYDRSGCCRALLEVTDKGARFAILSEDHRVLASMKAVDGHGQVCVSDPDGNPRAAIRSTKLGGLVKVISERGRPLGFLLGAEKGGTFELNNPAHRTGVSMYAEDDGGMIRVHQGGGEVMASMSAHDDSGLLSVFGDLGEQAVTLCAGEEGGHVLICDQDGNIRTNMV